MNVDSTTITKPSQNDNVITSQAAAGVAPEDAKSFKEEFIAVQSQENSVKETEKMTNIADLNGANTSLKQNNDSKVNNTQNVAGDMQVQQSFAQVQKETQKTSEQKSLDSKQSAKNADLLQTGQQDNNVNPQSTQAKASIENVKNNQAGQVQKDKNTKSETSSAIKAKNKDISESLDELSSKIATINELKSSASVKTYTVAKSKDTKSDSDLKIKMDNNDITFFINLTQNQGANAAASSAANFANLTSAKDTSVQETTQAASQSVQVSQTLLNALNESMQTNKPFRIDFGGDVAVIMKVDKNGNLSANFIPGSAAVENYLRNNIELLRQNFDNQNLPYNELTYSDRQKQDKQQRNNKENDDE